MLSEQSFEIERVERDLSSGLLSIDRYKLLLRVFGKSEQMFKLFPLLFRSALLKAGSRWNFIAHYLEQYLGRPLFCKRDGIWQDLQALDLAGNLFLKGREKQKCSN